MRNFVLFLYTLGVQTLFYSVILDPEALFDLGPDNCPGIHKNPGRIYFSPLYEWIRHTQRRMHVHVHSHSLCVFAWFVFPSSQGPAQAGPCSPGEHNVRAQTVIRPTPAPLDFLPTPF